MIDGFWRHLARLSRTEKEPFAHGQRDAEWFARKVLYGFQEKAFLQKLGGRPSNIPAGGTMVRFKNQ